MLTTVVLFGWDGRPAGMCFTPSAAALSAHDGMACGRKHASITHHSTPWLPCQQAPLSTSPCRPLRLHLTIQRYHGRRKLSLIRHQAGSQLTYGSDNLDRRSRRCAHGGRRSSSRRRLGSRMLVCQLQSIAAFQHLDLHDVNRQSMHCKCTAKACSILVGRCRPDGQAQPRQCIH